MLFRAPGTRIRPFSRRACLESLELRQLFSAVPPTVVDVSVSSTQWTTSFLDYLEANAFGNDGYSVPVGSADQLTPLPWCNIDQIRIAFSEDVQVDSFDLSVSGVNTTAYAFTDFAYDAQNYIATWTLNSAIEKDAIFLRLDSDGLDPVADMCGNALDGEWTTSGSTYASGNGIAGGDFQFRINVLPGDVNGSTAVSTHDYSMAAQIYGADTLDASYSPFADVDGSGTIDSDCTLINAARYDTLPTGSPAGQLNDAPTSCGLESIAVYEDAVDTVLSLWEVVDDSEDLDDELSYSIRSNTNSALFSATAVDLELGTLTLDYAANAFGTAELIIRVTDSGGLFIDLPLSVTVEAVNDAPVISDFWGTYQGADTWTFTGMVTDIDDDVEGFTVSFYGILEGKSATVAADGTFTVAVILPPSTWGEARAQTSDGEDDSNIASFWIGVT